MGTRTLIDEKWGAAEITDRGDEALTGLKWAEMRDHSHQQFFASLYAFSILLIHLSAGDEIADAHPRLSKPPLRESIFIKSSWKRDWLPSRKSRSEVVNVNIAIDMALGRRWGASLQAAVFLSRNEPPQYHDFFISNVLIWSNCRHPAHRRLSALSLHEVRPTYHRRKGLAGAPPCMRLCPRTPSGTLIQMR